MTTIENLKVGTKLQKTNQSGKYGVYSNITVSEVKETKSGRLMIVLNYMFTDSNGKTENGKQNFSNAPISKNTRLKDYGYSL